MTDKGTTVIPKLSTSSGSMVIEESVTILILDIAISYFILSNKTLSLYQNSEYFWGLLPKFGLKTELGSLKSTLYF